MSENRYWCPAALLPDGWSEAVQIDVDEHGLIQCIMPDAGKDADPAMVVLEGPVIPGMPNLHSHAHQRAMAGLGEKATGSADSFWSWREVMYKMLSQITPDQLYDIARMVYLEMLRGGYTHVAEFQYLHHDQNGRPYQNRAEMTLQCLHAARDVGIGFTALPVLYRYGGFGSQEHATGQQRFINDEQGYLEIWQQVVDVLESGESIGLTPHSLRAIDAELLGSVIDVVGPDVPVHIHIAEQQREVEDCVRWSDRRPVQWLYDNFNVSERWCLVHATHLNDDELDKIIRSGAVAGLCPTTEANLGDGFFRARELFNRQGRFGIGSDSQISVSVTEELRWLEYGQRLLDQQRNRLARAEVAGGSCGEQLFNSAQAGGQRACGFANDAIRSGSPATWLVLDPAHSRIPDAGTRSLLDAWIFSAGEQAIRSVYVRGKQLLQHGVHSQESVIENAFRQTLKQLSLD